MSVQLCIVKGEEEGHTWSGSIVWREHGLREELLQQARAVMHEWWVTVVNPRKWSSLINLWDWVWAHLARVIGMWTQLEFEALCIYYGLWIGANLSREQSHYEGAAINTSVCCWILLWWVWPPVLCLASWCVKTGARRLSFRLGPMGIREWMLGALSAPLHVKLSLTIIN